MLAVVQHQQQVAVLEVLDERSKDRLAGLFAQAQHLGHRPRYQRRIGQRGQLRQPYPIRLLLHHFARRGQRQPGLAHPAGADQRHQATLPE